MKKPLSEYSDEEINEMLAETNARINQHKQKSVKKDLSQYSDEEINQMLSETRSKIDSFKANEKPITQKAKEALQSLGPNVVQGTKNVGREVKRLASGVERGMPWMADLPNLPAIVGHAMGMKETPYFYEPVYNKVKEKQKELMGEEKAKELAPRNKLEEYLDEAYEAIPSLGIGKALMKGAPLVGRIASGLGATTGAKTYNELAENPGIIGTIGSSMVGGKAGKKLPGAIKATPHALAHPIKTVGQLGKSVSEGVKNTTAKGLNKITSFDLSKYNQENKLNLPMSIAGLSQSKIPKGFELLLSKAPFSAHTMEKFYASKKKALAKNMGITNPTEKLYEHGAPDYPLVRESAQRYASRMSDIYDKLMKPLEEIEQKALTKPHRVKGKPLIDELNKEAKGLVTEAEKADFAKTPSGHFAKKLESYRLPKKAKKSEFPHNNKHGISEEDFNKLQKTQKPETVDYIAKQIGYTPTDLTPQKSYNIGYKGLNELKKEARDLRDKLEPKTAAYVEMDQVHSKLRNLLTNTLEEIAPEKLANRAKKAKRIWAQYAGKSKPKYGQRPTHNSYMQDYVYDLMGTDIDKDAFNKITRNEKYMTVAYNGLPKARRKELTNLIISEAGKEGDFFNPQKAQGTFEKYSHPVKEVIYKNMDPQTRKLFKGTMEHIHRHKKEISDIANTSGTAPMMNLIKNASALGSAIGTGVMAGNPIPALGLGALYAGSYGAAKLNTNQKFIHRMAKMKKQSLNKPKLTSQQKLNNLLVNDLLTLPNARALSYNERHKGE